MPNIYDPFIARALAVAESAACEQPVFQCGVESTKFLDAAIDRLGIDPKKVDIDALLELPERTSPWSFAIKNNLCAAALVMWGNCTPSSGKMQVIDLRVQPGVHRDAIRFVPGCDIKFERLMSNDVNVIAKTLRSKLKTALGDPQVASEWMEHVICFVPIMKILRLDADFIPFASAILTAFSTNISVRLLNALSLVSVRKGDVFASQLLHTMKLMEPMHPAIPQLEMACSELSEQDPRSLLSEAMQSGDGSKFELFVEQSLGRAGRDARRTSATRDFGADVIVFDGPNRIGIVIQCKNWKSKVGISAVQEICAARMYYGAKIAAVAAPNGYTDAARKLAAKSDVVLWSLGDILELERPHPGRTPIPADS